jgi:hypothetical protein
VKRITVHGLRHTCATLLLSEAVPPHIVQRRLGHRSATMTMDIYAHALPSQQADAASRLATLLHGYSMTQARSTWACVIPECPRATFRDGIKPVVVRASRSAEVSWSFYCQLGSRAQ